MKYKSALIVLAASLALLLSAGLAIFVLPRLNSFSREIQLLVIGAAFIFLVLLSALLRNPGQKSERLARIALAELGFEKENWISRQQRGIVNGREFEILPFFAKGYGDTLALHILLRGTFNQQLTISLPRGLRNFVVWGAETDGQLKPAGYAGLQIFARDRLNAEAFLARPEVQRLMQELFHVPTQTPLMLEIDQGVIRLRIGHLGQLGFDAELLRRWLVLLGEIGQLAGSFQPLQSLAFDETELSPIRSKMRWIGILALLLTLLLSLALFFLLLFYLR